jgi:tetratricopeptide (TPR) repeat protein
VVPRPDLLAALGDVLTARGKTRAAAAQYATVEYEGTLARINRQVYNRQLAVFYADHHRHRTRALRLAQAELTVRKDIYGWDALAWTAYHAGRYALADRAAHRALALGTADPKLLYHAGMAALGAGNRDRARALLARALRLNPAFDLAQAPLARAALRAALPAASR